MTGGSGGALGRLRYLTAVGKQVLTDREARDARRIRHHLRSLRKLTPSLKVIGVADDGSSTFVHASDEVITPLLMVRGHFQRDDFHRSRAIAERLVPRPRATTFLDVGANVGTTTLYAARTGAFSRIVSVEPSPDNLEVLRLNVQSNGLDDLVVVAAAACGAEPGEVELMLSSVSAGDHRVHRAGDLPSTHQQVVKVPQRPLDEIVATAGVKPKDIALIWVDTQGHEPSVLAGADKVIAGGAPWVMEFWPEMYDEAGTLDAIVERIGDAFRGYVDVREAGEHEHPVSDLGRLIDRLRGNWHGQTDLVLLPKGSTTR
jgi:FkbM family methyltransferase